MRSRLAALALGSLLISATSQAATYYVDDDPSSCSDSSSAAGSQASPFCTPQRAAQAAGPGDEVIVADGSYADDDSNGITLNVVNGGSSESPVVFRSQTRWGAKLVGENQESTYCVNTATAESYIVIEGFDISGCATAINVNNDNHFVTIRGNHVHDIGRFVSTIDGGHNGISYGGASTDLVVDGNLFHTIGRLPGSVYPYNHDHGIYIRSQRVYITNNVFYGFTAGWAIHIYGPDLKKDIEIVNNTFAEPNPERDGHIILTTNTENVLVRNNVFHEPRAAAIRNSSACADITGLVMENNLTTAPSLISGESCGAVLSNNLLSTSAELVDAGAKNFRLSASSPAIDIAAPGAPDHDFDGTSRPQGAAADLGAFEYCPPGSCGTASAGAGGGAGAGSGASGGSGATGGGSGSTGQGGSSGSPALDGGDPAAAPSASEESAGCGCRLPSSQRTPSELALLLVAGVALLRRLKFVDRERVGA